MCGIAGKFNFADNAPVPRELIARMNVAQRHRGPDGSGEHFDRGIGLAHTRLSIIDVGGGHQPMSNEDGTIWIVFNGEIYNFPELRDRLEAHGHKFRTHCDTEAIVHLYEDLGEKCVEELRGMFAFAIWDSRAEKLFLARDRLGIKPLHYAVLNGQSLVFGSEIKAILQDESVPRRVDFRALSQFLSFMYVPVPLTAFLDVKKLPPAHTLTCTRQGVRLREYWDVTYQYDESKSESWYEENLYELLTKTVRGHLLSDVPLGAFLSGGVDSVSIVGLMRQVITGPLITTSIGFAERDYNELPYAREMAQRFRADHHEKVVTPNIEHLIPLLLWSFDEPFADSSAVPTYYVSQTARQYVTVALSGDGGDELFAGYRRFELERLEHNLRGVLGPARAGLKLLKLLPVDWKFTGRNALESLTYPPEEACARKHFLFMYSMAGKQRLLSKNFRANLQGFDHAEHLHAYYRRARVRNGDWLNRALYVDMKTSLADDMLTKVDRMSMAVSLEVRPPLLDHKVVEFAATIPPAMKLRNGHHKHILKATMSCLLPQEILDRPKQGFRMPLREWLLTDLRLVAEDLLLSPKTRGRGYFESKEIERMKKAHEAGHRDYSHHLWQLMLIELWHRAYIDDAAPPRAPSQC